MGYFSVSCVFSLSFGHFLAFPLIYHPSVFPFSSLLYLSLSLLPHDPQVEEGFRYYTQCLDPVIVHVTLPSPQSYCQCYID